MKKRNCGLEDEKKCDILSCREEAVRERTVWVTSGPVDGWCGLWPGFLEWTFVKQIGSDISRENLPGPRQNPFLSMTSEGEKKTSFQGQKKPMRYGKLSEGFEKRTVGQQNLVEEVEKTLSGKSGPKKKNLWWSEQYAATKVRGAGLDRGKAGGASGIGAKTDEDGEAAPKKKTKSVRGRTVIKSPEARLGADRGGRFGARRNAVAAPP